MKASGEVKPTWVLSRRSGSYERVYTQLIRTWGRGYPPIVSSFPKSKAARLKLMRELDEAVDEASIVRFSGHMTKASFAKIALDCDRGTTRTWRLSHVQRSVVLDSFTFEAFVLSWVKTNIDGSREVEIALRIDGVIRTAIDSAPKKGK